MTYSQREIPDSTTFFPAAGGTGWEYLALLPRTSIRDKGISHKLRKLHSIVVAKVQIFMLMYSEFN
jgi:hypothetical protein